MGRRQRRKAQATIDQLVADIEAEGYSVRFVEWVEDVETPGLLGQFAGITVHSSRSVKVQRGIPERVIAILSHELEHVRGAEKGTDYPCLGLRCGGSVNAFGEAVPRNTTEPNEGTA